MNDLVSIIIPVYNAENYLAETIQSALNQNYKSIELVIIDNGSNDNSLTIANSFVSDNVHVISLAENKGASAARNIGFENSKGNYIQFLDADDLLSVDKIEKQVDFLKRNPGFISNCNCIHFFDHQNPYQLNARDESRFLYDTENPVGFLFNLYGGNGDGWMVALHAWLCPREIILKAGVWNETLSFDDDGEYFCRVVLQCKGIVFVPNVFCYYRKHQPNNSLSNTVTKKSIESAFGAAESKEKSLESFNDSRMNFTFSKMYFLIAMMAFPQNLAAYKKAIAKHKHFGGTGNPKISLPDYMKSKYFSWIDWRVYKMLSFIKNLF